MVYQRKLPVWTNKKGKTRPCFPGASTIDGYDGVADELCDVRGAMTLLASSREVTNCGGDAVLDNHVGSITDGVTSSGESFQSMVLRVFRCESY
jgi:hypothetical protein